MLSMLLLLTAASQSAEVPAPSLRPATIQEMIVPELPARENAARMPVLSDTGFGCGNDVRLATYPNVGNSLLWRDGGDPVGLYRLLDRRVNGCPEPIVVNYRVPGSNAIGREAVAPGRGDRLPAD